MLKKLFLLLPFLACPVMANTYLGFGSFQSEFYGSEFDREYESDVNNIRQFKFGYNDRKYIDIFGGVNLDEDDQVRDFTLGFALKDKLIHLERGKISGNIISDTDQKIGEFDNSYFSLNVLDRNATHDGFMFGMGVQRYQVPHLFEYGDGSIQGPMLQDTALEVTSIGLGIFYDPIYNFLHREHMPASHFDWYFATSTLALNLSYVQTSDAPDMVAYGVDGKGFLMWGNTGTYELGVFYAMQHAGVRLAANLGYHLRANNMLNVNPAELFRSDAPEGDIYLDSAQTILMGLTAGVTINF